MGVGFGATGRVPAAEAEWPLSVRSGDLRRDGRQWARGADSRRSWAGNRATKFGSIAVARDAHIDPCETARCCRALSGMLLS